MCTSIIFINLRIKPSLCYECESKNPYPFIILTSVSSFNSWKTWMCLTDWVGCSEMIEVFHLFAKEVSNHQLLSNSLHLKSPFMIVMTSRARSYRSLQEIFFSIFITKHKYYKNYYQFSKKMKSFDLRETLIISNCRNSSNWFLRILIFIVGFSSLDNFVVTFITLSAFVLCFDYKSDLSLPKLSVEFPIFVWTHLNELLTLKTGWLG